MFEKNKFAFRKNKNKQMFPALKGVELVLNWVESFFKNSVETLVHQSLRIEFRNRNNFQRGTGMGLISLPKAMEKNKLNSFHKC